MTQNSDNFASMTIGSRVPRTRLVKMFPGLDESAYSRLEQNLLFCSAMQPAMRQTRKHNRTRLFKVESGKVALAYYRGKIGDLLYNKKDMLITFLVIDAGREALIPISLHSEFAPFSIVALEHGTTIAKVDEYTLEDLLANPTMSKQILRIQGELIGGICKNYPAIYSKPGKPLIPLFQVINKFVRENPETARFLLAELNKMISWISELDVSGSKIVHGLSLDVKSLSVAIIKQADINEALVDSFIMKLLGIYLKLRYYNSNTRKVEAQDASRTVDVLEETIELIINRFIIDLSKVS